ncbi:MAG: amidophosphoribosyltransferase [bacterium]|nr:amidophosphoribosyltransferase [bacterium]
MDDIQSMKIKCESIIQNDSLQEECAVFGIWNHPNASEITYLGLYALQHRGQEASGIVSSDGNTFYIHKNVGLVADVYKPHILATLKGYHAVGHNRYSTTGASNINNVQPLFSVGKDGPICIAHNGNLVNAKELRDELAKMGALFQTTTDTEVVLHLLARTIGNWKERFKQVAEKIIGAYTLILMTKNELIGIRDPNGIRPLVLGKLNDSFVLASESCAFDLIGAEYIRAIDAGEIIIINAKGLHSEYFANVRKTTPCIFELIYFSRPDSQMFNESIDRTRREMGKQLALESPANADFVISVPDSSNAAALGYAQTLGIPYEHGLIRNHYVGRTFINPTTELRKAGVKIKFNPVATLVKEKRIIVVEDSIVRGTTLKQLTKLLRSAGAREIHVRVASSPIYFPCPYGMDFPTKEELIANHYSIEGIRKEIGADSLAYLSYEGMVSACPDYNGGYCTACFNGVYPLNYESYSGKFSLE